jgi:hypothetical protein
MGCAKIRTRDRIVAQPGHVVVAMELDNRAQHAASLELGIVLQESEEDGHVIIPSSDDGESSLRAFVEASAKADVYRLGGSGYHIDSELWQAVQVRYDMNMHEGRYMSVTAPGAARGSIPRGIGMFLFGGGGGRAMTRLL